MGFHPHDIGRALVVTSFSFDKALLLLLNGIDVMRTKQDTNARVRRHFRQTVIHIDSEKIGKRLRVR